MRTKRADLKELVLQYEQPLRDAIRRTGEHWRLNEGETAELIADLWWCVLRNDARVLRAFRGDSSVSTYLYPILNRRAARWVLGTRRRQRREVLSGDTYLGFAEHSPSVEREGLSPDGLLARLDFYSLLNQLPLGQRLLLYQRAEGHTGMSL
jgi:DNA-directed RNA polymerase specialized sigma24 family protein